MSRLQKTALVTGAGKGVGSGVALELSKQYANVVVHYNSNGDSARAVLKQVEANGANGLLLQEDLGAPEGPGRLVRQTAAAFGGVDVLVNNAAVQYNFGFDRYGDEAIRRIFQVNLRGYLLTMQAVLPLMKEQGWGRIINISSVHAKRPTMFDPCYSMTKGGVKMLTRESAIEWADNNITVNAIELGYVEIGVKSGNPQSVYTERQLALPRQFRFKEEHPWGKVITPEQVGPLVAFLASPGGDMINGASIRLDCGAVLV